MCLCPIKIFNIVVCKCDLAISSSGFRSGKSWSFKECVRTLSESLGRPLYGGSSSSRVHSVTVSLPFSLWMLWPIFWLLLGFGCMLREFVSFLFLFCALNMWRQAQWKPFISLQEHILPKPRAYYRVEQSAEPDVWLDAVQVWEVKCADLSLSPVYKAAMGMVSPPC